MKTKLIVMMIGLMALTSVLVFAVEGGMRVRESESGNYVTIPLEDYQTYQQVMYDYLMQSGSLAYCQASLNATQYALKNYKCSGSPQQECPACKTYNACDLNHDGFATDYLDLGVWAGCDYK